MNTTKTLASMTVREAADIAAAMEPPRTLSEFLTMVGPIPTAPAGYVLHKANGKRWIGPEIVGPRWILTAVWTAATNEITIEVYTATHVDEKYTHLTASQALAMAADLVELSKAIMAGGGAE